MTKAQFEAMLDIADTISAMRGGGEKFTKEADRNLNLFDRMLKSNGFKRRFT